MIKRVKNGLGLCIAIVIVCSFLTAFGGVARAQLSDNDLDFTLSPQYPGPHQGVTITLISYSTDLDRNEITWSTNGSTAKVGTGAKTFSLTTGDVGTVINVDVTISSLTDGVLKKRITIIPAELDMLWQAIDSYVPPFYRGKTLPTKESKVRVVAMPGIKNFSGVDLPASSLSFQWQQDFSVVQSASGYNRNYFDFQNSPLHKTDVISVTATPVSETAGSIKKTVEIKYSNPLLLFYERDPILGVLYNHTVENGFTLSGEKTIVAEPFYISPKDISSTDLSYEWELNGATISSPQNRSMVTLRSSDRSGSATLSLSVLNNNTIFQEVHKFITLSLSN